MTLRRQEAEETWFSSVTDTKHSHRTVSNVAASSSAKALSNSEADVVRNPSQIGAQPCVASGSLRVQDILKMSIVQEIYDIKKAK